MYHHIKGEITKVVPGRIIIEAGGIGYDLAAPLSTTSKLSKGKNELVLLHLVVREDAMQLYGFKTEDERSLFKTLISISGVGAATAIQILSSVTPQDFIIAIEKQDTTFLKKIKGIGEKTAKRIILELKGAKTMLPEDDSISTKPASIAGDAMMALEAMGVPAKEAAVRVEKVIAKDSNMQLEEIIRKSLQG